MHIQFNLGTKLTILIFWNKVAQNGYFQSKLEKMDTTIEFCIFKSVYIPNFTLNWQFWFFWQICPKNYFLSKTEKVNITNEFCIFELVKVPNFSLNWQFWFFGPILPKKSISGQNRKKVNDLWFLHIWNSRYQTSTSRIKFAIKGYFQSKTEKMNSATELCIFKLVLVPNFSLNWQFWLSGPNLPKKSISSLNQKKWTPPLNFAYSSQYTYQISA